MEIPTKVTNSQLYGLCCKYTLSQDPSAPLCLLVHGRAGNFDVMWTFRRCIPPGVSILAPEAPLNDPIGGNSWWDIEQKPSAEDLAQVPARSLLPFTDRFVAQHALTPRMIIALGFSQGAGMLSICAQSDNSPFSAIALLAGFVVELPNATNLRQKPVVFMAHGTQDRSVPLEKAKRGFEFLKANGYQIEITLDPVGHKVGSQGMRALSEWIARVLL